LVGQGADQLGLVWFEALVDTVELLGGEVPDEVHREDLQSDDVVVVGFDGWGDLDGAGDVDARARDPEQTVQWARVVGVLAHRRMGVQRGSPQRVRQVGGGVDVCSGPGEQSRREDEGATKSSPSQEVRIGLLRGHLDTHPQLEQTSVAGFGRGPGQQAVATEPGVGVGGVEEGVDDRGVDAGSAVLGGLLPQQHEEVDVGVHIAGVAMCGVFCEVRDVVALHAQSVQKVSHDPGVVFGIGQDAFGLGSRVVGDALAQVGLVEGPGGVSGPAQALGCARQTSDAS
jgi:hypothetical protein